MSNTIIREYLKQNGGSEETQYLMLIKDILEKGSIEQGRNGTTKCLIGNIMYFSLDQGKIPILTTKKVAWKTCLKELLWFIRGDTNNETLKNQNVKIWNGNASREFLDSVGLTDRKPDDLGPIYGFQWRHFNADYTDCDANYDNTGIDQLQYIIDTLKNPEKRTSRRLIMTAWNPCQIDEMALPPCHVLSQFSVTGGNKLSCNLYQRSGDMGLGVPFNIASYAFLTHIIAHHCNLEAHELIYHLGNAHIYDDHFEALTEQITRKPHEFPVLTINTQHENINDYRVEDFVVENYNCHDKVNMKMRC